MNQLLKTSMATTIKHELKADMILAKGMDILWSKGYNGTSVNDIVKAADIPKGSFYFYFDSKEDFAIKALQRYFEVMYKPALEILADKGDTPKRRLLNFYEYRVKVMKEQLNCTMGCLACNLSNEVAEANENIRNAVSKIHTTVLGRLIDVAKAAQEAGEIDSSVDVKALISFIEDAGKGALISMKEAKSASPIDNSLYIVKSMLLK
ncbi:MAG: TetR/AcrR family transcriptional regulator [Bacteroidota bacterium]